MLASIANDSLLYLNNRVISQVPLHWLRLLWYRRVMQFEIGSDSYIFMDAWCDAKRNLKIGEHSVINQNCRLDTRGGINIGNRVSISAEVCILTADHDLASVHFEGRTRPVVIEDHVFIGTRAMILAGVTIGQGGAVAAGSIVTRNVEPFSIVAGVPARKIGSRPRELEYSISYGRLFA